MDNLFETGRMARKVCLVTGASRGIGRGIAAALCEQGHIVYISGRSLPDLEAAQAEAEESGAAAGGKCHVQVVDHNEDTMVEALFDRIETEQDGVLDLLVNNCFAGAVDGIKHGMAATGATGSALDG